MRILYFGMYGQFSLIPLQKLLANDVQICGVVVPTAANALRTGRSFATMSPPHDSIKQIPLLDRPAIANIVQVAWSRKIPAFVMSDPNSEEALDAIREVEPEVAIVACFSRRFPPALLAIPRFGFLNLHPSLLPRFRGPEPLFWTFREGDRNTGVTVHHLDRGIDSGPIALQAETNLEDGISGHAAERQCAELGATLLVQALERLHMGTLPRNPQRGQATYYPSPLPTDFAIDATWSAQRAFNFIKGTEHWRRPYPVESLDVRLKLRTALAFHPEHNLGKAFVRRGRQVSLQMNPGVLDAVVW